MVLDRLLQESARRDPAALALLEPTRSIGYGDLDRRVNRVAHALRASGVARRDRVVVAGENSIDFVAAYFGAMRAGAVAVPLPGGPRNDRFARALADCRPSVAVVDAGTASDDTSLSALADVPRVLVMRGATGGALSERWPTLEAEIADVPDTPPGVRTIDLDLAALIYTSGSTGEPKGVMLTHRNVVANARSIVQYLGLSARDRVMCVLPLYYVYGLSLLHTHVAVAGSIVLDNRFAYPNAVLQSMSAHHVTGFAGVPSTFTILLKRPDLSALGQSGLRYVTQAGGPMAPERIDEWRARLPDVPFYVMYGATEASAGLTYLDPSDGVRKRGSIGRAIPNVEIRVLRDDGSEADIGEPGELVARGSNISIGYWNDPDETLARFTADGYRTGDLGYRDAEGFLFLVGRRRDMLKVGAHRVGPQEIETVIGQHPAVQEVAVVGGWHEILGEVPIAHVVLRSDADDQGTLVALRAFCAERLPPFKLPQRFVAHADLPKIAGIGKIDLQALRGMGDARP